jgi:hypothetical protein
VTEIQYVDWYMTLTSTRRQELMNWVDVMMLQYWVNMYML